MLVQHGLPQLILQWLRKLNGFAIFVKLDSDNPIVCLYDSLKLCVYQFLKLYIR